jgi:putative FmdB family regulatory protein
MPHYEFFCRTCKKTFSRVLDLVDWAEGEIICPHCGSHEVELGLPPGVRQRVKTQFAVR